MLEISLLPEFGWSIKNEPVYGPGSAFQGNMKIIYYSSYMCLPHSLGFVKLNISEEKIQASDRLRIVYHATEATYGVADISPIYSNQLFGSQKVLWKKSNGSLIKPHTEIVFPFIIQMPMIQFPPSTNITSDSKAMAYHTNFTLSAFLDSESGDSIIKTHKKILYMPFIETTICKQPILISSKKSANGASVSLSAMDYLPGNSISVQLTLDSSLQSSVDSISISLYQLQTWRKIPEKTRLLFNAEKKYKHLISDQTTKIEAEASTHQLKLDIPVETIPSFSYSPVFTIGYQLQIKLKKKIWSQSIEFPNIPITIGTLGYGIRSSEEIKVYSTFKSVFSEERQDDDVATLPAPRFLDVVEYEDSLPIYENIRLPTYEHATVDMCN